MDSRVSLRFSGSGVAFSFVDKGFSFKPPCTCMCKSCGVISSFVLITKARSIHEYCLANYIHEAIEEI